MINKVSKIKNSLLGNDENYNLITDRLDDLKDWNSTSGVPKILKKYVDGSINKFVVFCKNQKHLEEIQGTVSRWFRKADIRSNKKLINWASRQRKYFRQDKLYDEQIEKLNSINFIFDIFEAREQKKNA